MLYERLGERMASSLMHLYVGNKFATKHAEITDLPQFYLGCIIPDFAEAKETRWLTHMRSSDIKEWYENNIAFYRGNVGRIDVNLLLGYVIHNITDAAFDEFLNVTERDYRFDYDQRKELWWINDVLPALKRAVPTEINGTDKDIAAVQLRKIMDESNFTYPVGSPVVVTVDMMDELSDIVCKIIEGFINCS